MRPTQRGSILRVLFSLLSIALPGCGVVGSDEGNSAPSSPDGGPPPLVGVALDMTIALEPITTRTFAVQGQTTRIPFRIRRGNGATGPVTITAGALRPGVVLQPLTLPANATEGDLVLDATADAAQGPLDDTITATTDVEIDGKRAVETASAALPLFVRGAPGAVDTTFGAGGFATDVFKDEAWLVDLVVLPSDEIVVVSELRSDVARASARRLSPDGKVDTTYGTQGTAKLGFNYPLAAALQADGKLVIVGGGNGSCIVGRLDASGAADASFGDNFFGPGTFAITTGASGTANAAYGVAIRPDGDLAVAFDWFNGVSLIGTARLSSTGALVGTYGTSGVAGAALGTSTAGAGIAVRSTGQIVAAGSYDGGVGIVQWSGDSGLRDGAFGAANGQATFTRANTSASPAGIVVLADDSVVAPYLDTSGQLLLARFAKDGKTLDPTFGSSGLAGPFAASGELTDIVRQGDGKLLVALSHAGGQEILRFSPTGALDTTFGSQGRVVTKIATDNFGKAIALQKDGRILVGGRATKGSGFDTTVTRYWP